MTYGMTARVALGNKCKEHEALITAITEDAEATCRFAVTDVFPSIKVLHVISGMRPKLEKIHRGLDEILENIVKDHKATKTRGMDGENDLLSFLLNLQQLGVLEVPLTNDHIKGIMLVTGSETSCSTVEWAMSKMVKTPQVMEKVQAEVRQVFGAKGNVDETGLQDLKFRRR
ncbi:putative tabersonine 16-hydroxylase [Rosa chinensis]|uniref:Putative tabersonine 16-hydroxylase n=1 Tax=Rosa chinensis TaxID=74649 RepID=A0A2P6QG65_ROSCH|nr:putative tabersonine 16-hydroxylase [Rosa chinensis]